MLVVTKVLEKLGMINFQSISGIIIAISDLLTVPEKMGCIIKCNLHPKNGRRNSYFIIHAPETYFVDHIMVRPGDIDSGFYDANAPVPLIYPPQYQASGYGTEPGRNVKVDFFDEDLVSSDSLFSK